MVLLNVVVADHMKWVESLSMIRPFSVMDRGEVCINCSRFNN